jgi:hypothetical protein
LSPSNDRIQAPAFRDKIRARGKTMPLTQLAPPYPIFTGKNGDPLDAGFLYFGVAGKNPETHPIQVYYDISLTQPVAQPIRTSNGYVMRNGTPTLIYANDQFSVTVRDKSGSLVIYSPVGYGIAPGSAQAGGSALTYDTFVGDGVTVNFTLTGAVLVGTAADVFINGVYQSKDNYSITGGVLTFSTAPPLFSEIEVVAASVSNLGGTNASAVVFNSGFAGAINRTAEAKMAEMPSVKDFGAIGDGLTDDTAAFNAAWAATAPQAVYVPAASYAITGTVTGKFFSFGVATVVGGTVTTITNLVP